MIPDFQSLMRPILEEANTGEVHIREVIKCLATKLNLSDIELSEMLPSGRYPKFENRVHWAKSYLKQSGLVNITKRGFFVITERGRNALSDNQTINTKFLKQFPEFNEFVKTRDSEVNLVGTIAEEESTPDEILRAAYTKINASIAADLLDRVRSSSPTFFENVIVSLLLAMGYGGTSEQAGRALGRTGDDGIDGVIDQDPLGVDQIYIQAKRYAEGNNIGAGALRDFYGALSIKKAQKGIFVTTSSFSPSAIQTVKDLSMRIVLINGQELTKLMLRYNVGCRSEEVLYLKKIDEDFFSTMI